MWRSDRNHPGSNREQRLEYDMEARPEQGMPNHGKQSGQGFWSSLLGLLTGGWTLEDRFARWTGLSLDSALQLRKIQGRLREGWSVVEEKPLRGRQGASEAWMSAHRKPQNLDRNRHPGRTAGKAASPASKAPGLDEEVRGLDDIFTHPMSALLIEESLLEPRPGGKRKTTQKATVSSLTGKSKPLPAHGALPTSAQPPAQTATVQVSSHAPTRISPAAATTQAPVRISPTPSPVVQQAAIPTKATGMPASPAASIPAPPASIPATMPKAANAALRFDESLRKQVRWPQSGAETSPNPKSAKPASLNRPPLEPKSPAPSSISQCSAPVAASTSKSAASASRPFMPITPPATASVNQAPSASTGPRAVFSGSEPSTSPVSSTVVPLSPASAAPKPLFSDSRPSSVSSPTPPSTASVPLSQTPPIPIASGHASPVPPSGASDRHVPATAAPSPSTSPASERFLKPQPEPPRTVRPVSPPKSPVSSLPTPKTSTRTVIREKTTLSRDGLRVQEVHVKRTIQVQESVSIRFSPDSAPSAPTSDEWSGLDYLSHNTHMVRNSLTSLVNRYFRQSELEDDASFY